MKKTEITAAAKKEGVNYLSFKRDKTIRAMSPYYWRHQGGTVESLVAKIKKAFPNAEILGDGDEFKAFRGGASVSQGSHIWVDFKLPI